MVKFKRGDTIKITDSHYKDFRKYANYIAVIDSIDKGNKSYTLKAPHKGIGVRDCYGDVVSDFDPTWSSKGPE